MSKDKGSHAGTIGSSKGKPVAGSKVGQKFKTPSPSGRSGGTQSNTGFGSAKKRAIGRA